MTLEWYEMALAVDVGCRRQIEALRNGSSDRYGAASDPAAGWLRHIEGAAGELAVAKLLGRYFGGSVNTFHGSDLGDKLQVRTRSRADFELLVRDGDSDEHYFVLVTGSAPKLEVVGWIQGADAKRPEWRHDHGGHGPAYFVPHAALKPIKAAA